MQWDEINPSCVGGSCARVHMSYNYSAFAPLAVHLELPSVATPSLAAAQRPVGHPVDSAHCLACAYRLSS